MSKQVYSDPASRSSSTVYSADSSVGVISSGYKYHNFLNDYTDTNNNHEEVIKEAKKNKKQENVEIHASNGQTYIVPEMECGIDMANELEKMASDALEAYNKGEIKPYKNKEEMIKDILG